MNILALDLGTKCGWAVSDRHSGVWDLQPSRFDSAGQRFVKLKTHLEVTVMIHDINLIVYEEVRFHRAIDAGQIHGGMIAVIQMVALDHKIEYRGVGVSTILKHAIGKGMAPKGQKKEMMFQAAVKKFRATNVIDDNHSDALWLLDLATNQAGLTKS